jgi:hypothetical protein
MKTFKFAVLAAMTMAVINGAHAQQVRFLAQKGLCLQMQIEGGTDMCARAQAQTVVATLIERPHDLSTLSVTTPEVEYMGFNGVESVTATSVTIVIRSAQYHDVKYPVAYGSCFMQMQLNPTRWGQISCQAQTPDGRLLILRFLGNGTAVENS